MNKTKQKIAALSLISSMLVSTSGCKKDNIKLEYNEETKQEELVGNANYKAISNYYIVEIENADKSISIYLTSWFMSEYSDFKNRIIICRTGSTETGKFAVSNLGTVNAIIPFTYFLSSYDMVKSNYTAEEINTLFENIKNDYDKFEINEEKKVYTKTN